MMNKLVFVIILVALTNGLLSQSFGGELSPKELYDQGIAAGKKGDCARASTALGEAQTIRPGFEPISRALVLAKDCTSGKITGETAESLFTSIYEGNRRNWDSALDSALKAVRLAPNYAEAHVHLGTVYSKLAEIRGKASFAKNAIEAYRTALEIEPTNGYAHLNLGVAYASFRQWKLAKKHLRLAVSYDVMVPPQLTTAIEKRMGGR